jgi:mono/diheme cytochrome c family protein
MPASGLEGGGAMTVQEVDQVIAYLRSLQISQMEAFEQVDDVVATALDRMAGGAATIEARIVVENAALADIRDGPSQFDVIRSMPDDIDALLSGPGTCTVESAALVGAECAEAGPDADRDGLTDDVEPSLTALSLLAYETLTKRSIDPVTLEESTVFDEEFDLEFSPTSPFSMSDTTGNPIPDLESAEAFISHLDAVHLEWSLLTDRNDQFAEPVINGIAFLEDALALRAWEVDFDQVAADTGLTRAEAERSVGLFNAYCARCHTAGYSAGVEFEQQPGSGAWAPALTDGRTLVQFPDEQDHVDFIINGANASERYGVNGLSGVGGMPAFGAVLSLEDIELIVKYERSM